MILMKERKFMHYNHGQSYALYKKFDEQSSCEFTHVHNWIVKYLDMLRREFMQKHPLFPRACENIGFSFFGDFWVRRTSWKQL